MKNNKIHKNIIFLIIFLVIIYIFYLFNKYIFNFQHTSQKIAYIISDRKHINEGSLHLFSFKTPILHEIL